MAKRCFYTRDYLNFDEILENRLIIFFEIQIYQGMKLMNIILGENDDFLRGREACGLPDDKEDETTKSVPEKFSSDVMALAEYVGEADFKSGHCIEIALSELLNVVPRNRRRVDAYNALVRYLKENQNITLTIKTNKI